MIDNLTTSTSSIDAANTLFRMTSQRGRIRRIFSMFTHRCQCLLDLEQTLCCQQVQGSHYAGIKTIDINSIRGTQGKADAFDAFFYPTRETSRGRWTSIAREHLLGHGLPPVEVIDVDGVCFVRDGHHRISVARGFGQAYIDAEVTIVNLVPPACSGCQTESSIEE